MKRTFAVTGGIACGKSALASCLEDLGYQVLDTDLVAHSLEDGDGAATPLIAKAFGREFLLPGGGVDRKKLSKEVFSNPSLLSQLNSIVHPLIEERMGEWMSSRSEDTISFVLVPLLFEAKLDEAFEWDGIIAVVCSREEQIRRMVENRSLSREEAIARIDSQMDLEEKAKRANYLIENDGTLGALREKTENLLKVISSL